MKPNPPARCDSLAVLPIAARQIMDKAQDIYSAFVVTEKLSDFLSIDPLRLLPIFSNEIGLVSQIQNRTGKDTGLGQLTGPAIRDTQKKWKKKTEIDSSEKASCAYVRELIEKTGEAKFFEFPERQRCQLMFSEEGATRNIVFSLFFNRINRDYISHYFAIENIFPLVIRAGGYEAMAESLKELLVMLSYNSGAKTAVINLKSFLESRIALS